MFLSIGFSIMTWLSILIIKINADVSTAGLAVSFQSPYMEAIGIGTKGSYFYFIYVYLEFNYTTFPTSTVGV